MPVPSLVRIAAAALLLAAASSVDARQTGRGAFRLDADAARFIGSDSLTYVEIYYAISEAALTYAPDSVGFRAAASLSITVADGGGVIAERSWTIPRSVRAAPAPASAQNIISMESLALPGGEYVVTLSARDSVAPDRRDSAVMAISIPDAPPSVPAVSDIELCTRVTPGGPPASLFTKNTLEVVPNPSRLYGGGLPVLHFYGEIYNLDTGPEGELSFRASIVDGADREVVSQSKRKPRRHRSSVEYGSMNVGGLPGGSYRLRIAVIDSSRSPALLLASSEKRFFVYNPGMTDTAAAAAPARIDAFALLGEAEADDELHKIRYLLGDRAREQVERLEDLGAKRAYLREFWTERRSPPGGGPAVSREEYLDRVRGAERYSERNRAGWQTDRGRVAVVYGPPDEIERFPSQPESRPYEIWEYRALQGGVVFVFVDRLGFGGYRLVHSTHLSELRNEEWFRDEASIR